MYSQTGHAQVSNSTVATREWRSELKTAKSPRWSHTHSREHSYPSPPMSDTPTSPGRSSQHPASTISSDYPRSYPVLDSERRGYPPPATSAMEGSMLPAVPLYQQAPYGQDPRSYYPPPPRLDMHGRQAPSQSPYPPQSYESYLPPAPQAMPLSVSNQPLMPARPTFQQGRADPVYQQGPTSLSSSSAPRTQRATRRTKAHVAKACQNCKKAHLSCDESRPCARCVGSGKQTTCVDVEHKKRGRPRLRDDREQRLEQAAAAAVATLQAAPSPLTGPDSGRGHRRGDSLRVLRSQAYGSGSDDSRPSTSQGIEPPRSYARTSAYPSAYPGSRPLQTQLFAFLNLEMQFLKVSEPLRALLGGGQEILDRPLGDFVAPIFAIAVQRVQSELRAERTQREPTYLPAIYPEQQERAAVRDHEPDAAESLSSSFHDRQDVYTFRIAGRHLEQFQVRIRLARTSTFFATMILYRLPPPPPQSIQPMVASSPYARGTQYGLGGPSSPARSPYDASNPDSPFTTLPTALMTTLPPPSSIPASSSMQVSYMYGSEQGAYFPRTTMHPPPPPPQAYPSGPMQRPTTAQDQSRRGGPGEGVYLPPIVSSAPTTPFGPYPTAITRMQTPGEGSSRRPDLRHEEEEDDGRKRRRLNINDIVEK